MNVGITNPKYVYKKQKCIYKPGTTNILQLDGNVTDLRSDATDGSFNNLDSDVSINSDDSDKTIYNTEDEAFSDPIPVNLQPVPGQSHIVYIHFQTFLQLRQAQA